MSDAERWAQLKEVFAALSELPLSDQRARLSMLADRDPELARRVRALLEADARADAVLEKFNLSPDWPGVPEAPPPLTDPPPNADDRRGSRDPFGYSGATVAPYRVLEILGVGGMGVVYRAEDTRLGRSVALKFLLPQYSFDPDSKERFLQEARAASTLDHPNVCTVYGVGESDRGHLFLAMACYEGETLKARLARSAMEIPDAVRTARQILDALRAAHAAGIVHRDLKPGNVMLMPDGTVKILDFGLAKMSDLSLTGSGLRPGTVAYMSPEQVAGNPVDHRTDLWSLGVLMYEMVGGQRPFRGGHDLSTVYAILNEEPDPPSVLRPDLPPAYDAIVHRLLRKDRDERYATAAAVMDDLDVAGGGEPVRAAGGGATAERRWPRRPLLAAGVLGIVVLVGALVTLPHVRGTAPSSAGASTPASPGNAVPDVGVDARSIAVLPFVDMSAERDQAYFSDGITEEILNALAQVPDLRVPARTSSFSFKGRDLQVREIARQLGVATVLEGSVRKDGNTVRITAQLIDARSDRHVWSQTFDRDLADVFAVQTEIARTVAEALKVRLADGGPLTSPTSTPSALAHDLYLQGRFHWNRRSADDLRRAIATFEEATRADSTYARAYSGLALAYAVLPITTGDAPVESAWRRAEDAAVRAIALDPSDAEAHAALGYAYHWQWRWHDAERALRRATELDPANTVARQWYGEHLAKMDRGREAEAELRRAVVLDPLSPIAHINLALVLMLDGRFDEAIGQAERTSRMDPSFSIPQILLHRMYLLAGRAEESASAGRRFAEMRGMRNASDFVALGLGIRGPAERAAAIGVLARWARDREPQWPELAMYYGSFGERDEAIEALEHAMRVRAPMMTNLKVSPWFDALRGDARFERMLRALRFP